MIKKCNYVGIDISKLSFDVALKNEKEKYSHYKFSNDLKGFKALLKLIKSSQSICVMEASGPYYLNLATYKQTRNWSLCY